MLKLVENGLSEVFWIKTEDDRHGIETGPVKLKGRSGYFCRSWGKMERLGYR